jgi:DNA polymerase III subunit gamma/tau
MSYLVLARKYRPRSFTEMVGQAHVVQALTNALTSQRLHHAYFFTGTRGVGKTTISRILAKSLNCLGADGTGGITATPCGVCQACVDIDAGRFVDYTELDAASNRSVDEVQALLEQAVYKPVQGRFKVFMIDEVHMLTGHAFNAMLKTLEEPPEYLKFVLATTDPQKVPVTVLSRCLQFNLRPIAPETIQEQLETVLQAENVSAEKQALRLIARAARGSMRDALSLTDQAIAFGAGQLQESTVRQMLGSVDRSHVFRLIEALAAGDGKTVVETSDALRVLGLSAASTLEEMAGVLQRMAVQQAVPNAVDESDPQAAELSRLAALMPADETQLLYSLCLHGRAELGLAPDEYAALTMVLLRLLAFKPQGAQSAARAEKKTLKTAEAPAARLETTAVRPEPTSVRAELVEGQRPAQPERVMTQPAPVIAQAEQEAATTQPPPGQRLPVLNGDRPTASPSENTSNQAEGQPVLAQYATKIVAIQVRESAETRADVAAAGQVAGQLQPTEEGGFWHITVQQLVAAEAVTALVRELALQSQLVARDVDHWLLRVERESLNQPASRERLQTALQALGHPIKLGVEVGRVVDSPAKRNAAAAAERQGAAEKLIYEDPFVQTMMRDFGAKIVPGSIKPIAS